MAPEVELASKEISQTRIHPCDVIEQVAYDEVCVVITLYIPIPLRKLVDHKLPRQELLHGLVLGRHRERHEAMPGLQRDVRYGSDE
eukprot:CAMPEP_0117545098 /NCGR_PEP_ID=MMETSP0784-20121206/45919_1 /TAXON_ID=39447 /ORGANISM="" /LENGTH=85 /DNA_ID=CAMNT_0005341933 /DNA_START=370 /DNA_END=627 /DNA_ORIENTATION=+